MLFERVEESDAPRTSSHDGCDVESCRTETRVGVSLGRSTGVVVSDSEEQLLQQGCMRSAGLRKVLYVDPRDVYLQPLSVELQVEYAAYVPLVIEVTVGDVQSAQECPYVSVGPVDYRINSLKARPSGVGWVSKAKRGCGERCQYVEMIQLHSLHERSWEQTQLGSALTNDTRTSVGIRTSRANKYCLNIWASSFVKCQSALHTVPSVRPGSH